MKKTEQARPINGANQIKDRVIIDISPSAGISISCEDVLKTGQALLTRTGENCPLNEHEIRGWQ